MRLSVRTRVLAAVLGAASLGMLVAGVTSYLVQRERVDSRIDDNIAQEVEEVREFARSGVDPETGAEFTSVSRFLEVMLQRNVPDSSEGLLTLVDGVPAWVPGTDVGLRLEDDPQFVRTVSEVPGDARVRPRTAETAASGTLRYVVVPVSVPGDPTPGRYVIAYSRDMEQAEVVDAYRTYAAVAGVSAVAVGLVGWAVVGRLLGPVRLLRETAQQISDTDLSGRIAVRGSDDVSELARTVNAMLDRLEVAFAAQREALDDAGHELRTPITIIRGHLELMDPADAGDVAETRTLSLDELDRMHRMVEELIVLAKAKRPDFVHPRPVAVGPLVDDVLGKAEALAPRRWQVDSRPETSVVLDPQRITQALLQLVANAVAFTEPDDTIAIGARLDGDTVRFWVRDTGSGIAPEDVERIFDRFARADTGRGVDGSGLGLAIVRAIAEAHRGQASVRSSPGYGATFTLDLPAAPADAPADAPAMPEEENP
ncbi:signal transduction histidine kinase [Haloactinopolyspora alba]|uniref:histidine kinase n=1 Tax=Haloactinopolyspora alba TaxID=648780 RepID=A0A2P8DJ97_9ACTN|nr:HAMP domain-containing sensor histidine kinase [Haloactinopolyspora alba]PSK97271.1 signal transduction histidine kinase [Haloactinopolyspora alba]